MFRAPELARSVMAGIEQSMGVQLRDGDVENTCIGTRRWIGRRKEARRWPFCVLLGAKWFVLNDFMTVNRSFPTSLSRVPSVAQSLGRALFWCLSVVGSRPGCARLSVSVPVGLPAKHPKHRQSNCSDMDFRGLDYALWSIRAELAIGVDLKPSVTGSRCVSSSSINTKKFHA